MKYFLLSILLFLCCLACSDAPKNAEAVSIEKVAEPQKVEPTSFAYFGSTTDGRLVLANSLSNTVFVLEQEVPQHVPVHIIENGVYEELEHSIVLRAPNGQLSYGFRLYQTSDLKEQANLKIMEGYGILKVKHDDIASATLRQFARKESAEIDASCACLIDSKSEKKMENVKPEKCEKVGKWKFSCAATCVLGYSPSCK